MPALLAVADVTYRVRSVDHVPRLKRRVTPPAASDTPGASSAAAGGVAAGDRVYGRASPGDAAALRGLPMIGVAGGLGGAIRWITTGSEPPLARGQHGSLGNGRRAVVAGQSASWYYHARLRGQARGASPLTVPLPALWTVAEVHAPTPTRAPLR